MSTLQIELLLSGVVIFCFLRFILSSFTRKLPLAQTEKSRGFIILILNLVIVSGGLAITLYALNVTAGGAKMNEDQLAQLSQWVNSYFAFVWILAGVALGAILCWIAEIIIATRKKASKDSANKEEKITISNIELDSITKQIESYKKATLLLQTFFNKIQNDKPKE